MTKIIIKIYEYFTSHRNLRRLSFWGVTILIVSIVFNLQFKEDISDFLPIGDQAHKSLSVYQNISGANKVFAVFQYKDTTKTDADRITQSIDVFSDTLKSLDKEGYLKDITSQIDISKTEEIIEYSYRNIPFFLMEEDYAVIDSLLLTPNYVEKQIQKDKEMLMFPASSMLAENLRKDPLNIFTPVISKLQNYQSESKFELYDGYIFTPDMQHAIVMMTSPFGNSETQNNAKLVEMLNTASACVNKSFPEIEIHIIGGPVIAVGNASQIKKDSILATTIAIFLILALLFFAFRNYKNILLIVVSIVWGWLFALGGLAVVHNEVSLIVVGISSVILGIAVNYPLHLIAHVRHVEDHNIKNALSEIITPLVIGNITTVGAFLTLVPLDAVALRDLGIFSSFLLIGTILFVVLYLPHIISKPKANHISQINWLSKLSNISLEGNKYVLYVIILVTFILGYFSLQTTFDTNMSNINYMTDTQKSDMQFFQKYAEGLDKNHQRIYVVNESSELNTSFQKSNDFINTFSKIKSDSSTVLSSRRFLPSANEAQRRLDLWNKFIAEHKIILNSVSSIAEKNGFDAEAFDIYNEIISSKYHVSQRTNENPINALFSNYYCSSNGKECVVDIVSVPSDSIASVTKQINDIPGDHYCFDVQSMNSTLANNLSNNFNYIGWACGFIVFFFLWFSFGNIELAILSFIPMAISWIWILGIMALLDIHFNIVNVILATFIFGQGDDYTIFMTEGCQYEYAYRRKILSSYKESIVLSALIMFIGIGTLIIAKHPALHSLAEVTIIGMASVVLMAYVIPPFLFNWLVTYRGKYRKRPLKITSCARTIFCGVWWIAQLISGYIYGGILFIIFKKSKAKKYLRKYVTWSHRIDLKLMPGLKYKLENPNNEDFSTPGIIICNHQSMLDPMLFMALNEKILIVANQRSSYNPIVKAMFKWLDFYTIKDKPVSNWNEISFEKDLDVFKSYVNEGYSIVIFPEGLRNPNSSIKRYHKGPFYLAQKLHLDIIPVFIHGLNDMMPIYSFACHASTVTMQIGQRINIESDLWDDDISVMTKKVHKYHEVKYSEFKKKLEDTSYFSRLVKDRYLYKGTDIYKTVIKHLKANDNYTKLVDDYNGEETVVIYNSRYGECALLMALVHPNISVIGLVDDEMQCQLSSACAEGLVSNLKYVSTDYWKKELNTSTTSYTTITL